MLQIQPLTEPMQHDVLRRRFADSVDVEAFKEQQATSENLKEMATNPLLLALQIGVFMLDDKQLPELRTELYDKGVRLLLRRVEIGTSGARNVRAVAAAVSPDAPKRQRRPAAQRRAGQAAPGRGGAAGGVDAARVGESSRRELRSGLRRRRGPRTRLTRRRGR